MDEEELERESDVLALEMLCDVDAPSRVRDAVRAIDGIGSSLGDAILIASELVTNTLRQSAGSDARFIQIRVRKARDRLLISVRDPDDCGHGARAAGASDPGAGGAGLWLVQRLAHSWGGERRNGYRVWAELQLAS